ncbi:cyclin like F box protein [Trypanosoma vivax]|nr:cyclin like F box protein [Trypanosoma vivax]
MRVQMGRVPEEDGAGDAQSGTAPCAEGRAKEVSPGPAAFSRGSSPAFSPGLSSLVPSSVRSKAPRGHGQLPEHVPFGGCAAPASGAQVCDGPLMVKLQAPAGACARHSTRPLDELSRDELMGESSASTGSDVPGDSGEDGAAVRLPATATAAGGGRVSSLHGLPDAVLLGIVPYLCLPEVLALLTVTRKLNRLVRQYFAVNSHGVLSIPAFDSRASCSTGRTGSRRRRQAHPTPQHEDSLASSRFACSLASSGATHTPLRCDDCCGSLRRVCPSCIWRRT